jgi:hypothetical protein
LLLRHHLVLFKNPVLVLFRQSRFLIFAWRSSNQKLGPCAVSAVLYFAFVWEEQFYSYDFVVQRAIRQAVSPSDSVWEIFVH